MPRLRKEIEDKIKELIDQEYSNIEITEKTGIHRKTIAKRRKEYLKRDQEEEKPEPEPEKTIQQEKNDSHPLDPQIYTLIRYQGTNSRKEAIKQAIATQHSFNPYILNHGLESPKELIKFFEDELKLALEKFKELKSDLDMEIKISRGLIFDQQKTIAELEELT